MEIAFPSDDGTTIGAHFSQAMSNLVVDREDGNGRSHANSYHGDQGHA
jgi:hypothetical protein